MCRELGVSAASRNNSAMCGPWYPDCHRVLFCPCLVWCRQQLNEWDPNILTLSFIVSYTTVAVVGSAATNQPEWKHHLSLYTREPRLRYKQWISVILSHSPGFSFITDFVCNFQIFYYSKENWITSPSPSWGTFSSVVMSCFGWQFPLPAAHQMYHILAII